MTKKNKSTHPPTPADLLLRIENLEAFRRRAEDAYPDLVWMRRCLCGSKAVLVKPGVFGLFRIFFHVKCTGFLCEARGASHTNAVRAAEDWNQRNSR